MTKWWLLVTVLWTFSMCLWTSVVIADLPMCYNNGTDNTTQTQASTCCLCRADNCTAEPPLECPDGYAPKPGMTCLDRSATEPVKTTTATTKNQTTEGTSLKQTPTTESSTTVNSRVSTEASSMEDDKLYYTVCISMECGPGEYFDTKLLDCKSCSHACVGCNGSSSDCIICRYEHNGNCVESCPPKTKEGNVTNDGNTTQCDDVPDDSEGSKKLYVYVGAGAGGGVLVIVVIVVIVAVVICRRRRTGSSSGRGNGRTAMSQIIEDRNGDDNKPEEPPRVTDQVQGQVQGMGTTQSYRPPAYHNIQRPGEGFATQVEQQTDTVLRYTKDPTDKKKKSVEKPRVDSTYTNAAMARLHQTMNLAGESEENISHMIEEQEVKSLGVAPLPPGLQTPTKKPKGNASIIKRLSQRIQGKRGRTQKSKGPDDAAPGEDYIDMSSTELPQEEDYENVNLGEPQLEDYENIPPKNQQLSSSQSAGKSDSKPVKPKAGSQSAGKSDSKPVKPKAGSQSRGNVAKEGENVVTQSVNDDDLEDYENVPKNLDSAGPNKEEDGMEDYENTPMVSQSDVAPTPAQQDIDTFEQEDYEPMEFGAQNESPYMNVTFNNK